jgi:uncharacterized protein YeaO (DUF488 family)
VRSKYPEAVLIGISRIVPSWGDVDERERILAPSDELRRADLTDAAFRRRYIAELDSHRDAIGELINAWERRGRDVVLFCYEREPDDCHRGMLAAWIGREFGIEVTEVAT